MKFWLAQWQPFSFFQQEAVFYKLVPLLLYLMMLAFLYQYLFRFQIASKFPFSYKEKDSTYVFYGLASTILILFSFLIPKKINSALDVNPEKIPSDLLAYNSVYYLHSTISLSNAVLYCAKCFGIIACLWGIFKLREPSSHDKQHYIAVGLFYIMSGILLINAFEAMIL